MGVAAAVEAGDVTKGGLRTHRKRPLLSGSRLVGQTPETLLPIATEKKEGISVTALRLVWVRQMDPCGCRQRIVPEKVWGRITRVRHENRQRLSDQLSSSRPS